MSRANAIVKRAVRNPTIRTPGFVLQQEPLIYFTAIEGPWLLRHTTPMWRMKHPEEGFQRVVKPERAKAIAVAVLEQQRSFPNAIVLATDSKAFDIDNSTLRIPGTTRFLVVDGQHRLWAQKYSHFVATYGCVIHMNMTEVEMARLFIEINDNQKRVPSSLRWDLVRLVRPEDDPFSVAASDLVYALVTEKSSPLYRGVDLTGEQPEISLNQGSLAPELRTLVSSRKSGLRDLDFESQYEVIARYIWAIRSLDENGWRRAETPFYKARVLRAIMRLLPDIVQRTRQPPLELTVEQYASYLSRIDPNSLSDERIRGTQGSAGMKQIYDEVRRQVFGGNGDQ